jgi:hypothetical protein
LDCSCWDKSGTAFHIYSSDLVASDVLPQYFRHNNFASFQRQLNYFGFSKIGKGTYTYAHESFVRSAPHLLAQIKRKTNMGNLSKRRRSKSIRGGGDDNNDDSWSHDSSYQRREYSPAEMRNRRMSTRLRKRPRPDTIEPDEKPSTTHSVLSAKVVPADPQVVKAAVRSSLSLNIHGGNVFCAPARSSLSVRIHSNAPTQGHAPAPVRSSLSMNLTGSAPTSSGIAVVTPRPTEILSTSSEELPTFGYDSDPFLESLSPLFNEDDDFDAKQDAKRELSDGESNISFNPYTCASSSIGMPSMGMTAAAASLMLGAGCANSSGYQG